MPSLNQSGLRVALAAVTLCAGAALAQQRAEPASPGPRQAAGAEDARELRRILVLRNGQAVRAVTRLRDGAWEYKQDGAWRPIDARAVASARLEREVLAEKREREEQLGDEPGARVAFAGWLAESGLVNEGLEVLDAHLEAEPHDRAALELLRGRRWVVVPSLDVPPERLEAAKEELFRFGGKVPRAARELAILELEWLEDREALKAELAAQLHDSVLRTRVFAAQALGRLFTSEELRGLLVRAVLDTSEEVRRESSYALGAVEDPAMIVPVVRAMESQNPRVRAQAAEALGNMGYAAAVEPLMARLATVAAQGYGTTSRVPHSNIFIGKQFAYIQDFDVEVAQFQAVADPQVNTLIEGNVLDAGVQGTQHFAFAYESKVLRGALGNLTGENPGYTSRAWMRWWEENQSRYGLAAAERE